MNNTFLWQKQEETRLAGISEPVRQLLQCQSLTAGLKESGYGFSVSVLHLGRLGADSLLADGWPEWQQQWFGRDVCLCLDGTPVVWARSLCLPSAHIWQEILNCGTRPLGERLFDGSLPLQRSAFEYLPGGRLEGEIGLFVAARRSFFELSGQKLGLVECFLPALSDYLK
ncbi:chorismate--pyruvate lyase family protein [Neisseria weaveri]|uniref:Putative 4-hydroxybenzoate synthetase n=1 Tax=Neisseria weaveri TaxID=28091 RepID=A0A3S4ZE19_9NEIS|nr:chorismate lyase [Neisseria weaveri]EGV36512.1 chorismate lyase [Neisseria weaveri ATCC 51223]EGV37902.1 chorismate lyase [Neisseria weaveri LMG 5135]VEJ51687.1 putative 4-hydroxybenzoate synthetase [Neisseria weaveri]